MGRSPPLSYCRSQNIGVSKEREVGVTPSFVDHLLDMPQDNGAFKRTRCVPSRPGARSPPADQEWAVSSIFDCGSVRKRAFPSLAAPRTSEP